MDKRHDGYKSRKFWFSVGCAAAVGLGYYFAVWQSVKGGGVDNIPTLFHAFTFAMFVLSGVYGAQNVSELVFGSFSAKRKGAEEAPKVKQ